MGSKEAGQEIHRRITRTYMLALGLIALTVICALLLVKAMLASQDESAKLINISGRQRMLSQRVSLASMMYANSRDESSRELSRQMLTAARDLFLSSHNALVHGDEAMGLHARLSRSLKRMYFADGGVDQQVRELVLRIDQLIEFTPPDPEAQRLAEAIVATATTDLLSNLDAIVKQYETEAEAAVGLMELIETALCATTIFALIAEAAFIFSPLARTVAESTDEIVRITEEADWAANHDALTNLPNRRMLAIQASEAMRTAAAANERVGFWHIDLDKFKHVNDTLGHLVGDQLLVSVADTLREIFDESDLIARVGGDEFLVMRSRVKGVDEMIPAAQQTVERLSVPVEIGDNRCHIGSSIGIAISQLGETNYERVIAEADIALYAAKDDGRGTYRVCSEEMRQKFNDDETLTRELRVALRNEEFLPWFQPIVDQPTGELIALEAYARWSHPSGKVLEASKFAEAASRIQLMGQIDLSILEQGLRACADWRVAGLNVPRVNFNFRMQQLEDPSFVNLLVDVVKRHHLQPSDVGIELRETSVFDKLYAGAVRNIRQLANLGFVFEIDDFGSSQAALNTLLVLPSSSVKIDRSLIRDIDSCSLSQTLVRSIITTASELGIRCIAKGVESNEQVEQLLEMGCSCHQGFLHGRPMTETMTGEWIAQRPTGDLAPSAVALVGKSTSCRAPEPEPEPAASACVSA